MRFSLSALSSAILSKYQQVALSDGQDALVCTLEEFLDLEPGLNYVPNAQEAWEGQLEADGGEVTTIAHTLIQNGGSRPALLPSRAPYVLKIAEYRATLGSVPRPPTLAEVVAEVQGQIRAWANGIRAAITEGVSPAEAGAWTNKEAEAMRVQSGGGPEQAPMLAAEAAARQVTLAEVAGRVLAHAQAWRVLEGRIAGVSGWHRDQVALLESVGEVQAYDWSTGWPGVGA